MAFHPSGKALFFGVINFLFETAFGMLQVQITHLSIQFTPQT